MSEVHSNHVIVERGTSVGLITLNRAEAMNALSLGMIQTIAQALIRWRDDPSIAAVALRGSNKAGDPGSAARWFGHFCAGGDIRFFHDAAKVGDPLLEEFFTQEYTLNHLIHTYNKPIVAFMDGVVMGGGMGLCQGIALRLVTEKTKMAMPETKIGLFPDVGGGYFLSRCPGSVGEYLALTGQTISADEAIAHGLADVRIAAADQAPLWDALSGAALTSGVQALQWLRQRLPAAGTVQAPAAQVEAVFSLPSVTAILGALDGTPGEWASATAKALRERSPLMLHVALEQIRRARHMGLADELRMECDIVWRCFNHRPVADSETVEGIRALAVDKDHAPRWKPATVAQVDAQEVVAFFKSPWKPESHPLRHLR